MPFQTRHHVGRYMGGGGGFPAVATSGGWQFLPVGAGGNVLGYDIAGDNTMVVRTDGTGPWLWQPNALAPNGNTGVWVQILNAASMPVAITSLCYGNSPPAPGVWEVRICYNNSNIMYMVWPADNSNSGVYKTIDKGQTWTLTGFTPISTFNNFDANSPFRGPGPFMDIDPNNANNVYLGSQASGLFLTRDGGATWSAIPSSSVSFGNNSGVNSIVVDPTNSNTVYVASFGTGVYVTTNANLGASATWTLTTGGPKNVFLSKIDRNNGRLYATNGRDGDVWTYASGTWTDVLVTSHGRDIAPDPNLANHVIVSADLGVLNESFDGGSTWGGWSDGGSDSGSPVAYSATGDILWMTTIFPFAGVNNIFFDRTVPRKLYMTSPNGFFNVQLSGNVTTSTAVTMNSQGRGIENLTSNHVVTPNGNLVLAVWDDAIFHKTSATINTYPSVVALNAGGLNGCFSVRDAPNSTFVAACCTGAYGGGQAAAGYFSNDSGNTWTKWSTTPNGANSGYGVICPSTSSNIMWAPIGGIAPYYTTNGTAGGPTWTQITLPGNPSFSNFLLFGENAYNPNLIAADTINIGTFYLVLFGAGTYFTTNGGVTWTAGAASPTNINPFCQMKATPGIAGDLWMANGLFGPIDQGPTFYHTTNGGVSWTALTNIVGNSVVGFGAPKPGGSGYPAVFTIGFVTDTSATSLTVGIGPQTFTVSANSNYYAIGNIVIMYSGGTGNRMIGKVTAYNRVTGVLSLNVTVAVGSGTRSPWNIQVGGIWQSDDAGSTWSLVGGEQYPNQSLCLVSDISGDPNIYGQVYTSLYANGFACFVPGK